MSDDAKPQGTVQIALRISPDLRERVKLAAEANNRSVNSELTATLEAKYPPPDTTDWDKFIRVFNAINDNQKKIEAAMKKFRYSTTEGDALTFRREIEPLLDRHMLLVAELPDEAPSSGPVSDDTH